MSVTVQCPGCRHKYATHERHAGRRVTCKQCGVSMHIPEPDAASRAAWKIPFLCENCGKSYLLSSDLAGKKMVCTQCGVKSRIPAGALLPVSPSEPTHSLKPIFGSTPLHPLSHGGTERGGPPAGLPRIDRLPTSFPTVPATDQPVLAWNADPALEPLTCDNLAMPAPLPIIPEVKPASEKKPERAPEPPVEKPLDIYGLDDPPPPATPETAVNSPIAPAVNDPADLLPQRLGEYKPLSEVEKKKIRKRADRLDKMRSYSGATIGVSFGTVLTITLFGWRMYKLMTIFKPDPSSNQIFLSAPGEPVDFKAAIAENDRQYARRIAQSSTVEALEWLDTTRFPNHAVSEMTVPKARELVTGYYQHGAEKVYAVDPVTIGNTVLAEIVVKLPSDITKRRECLTWLTGSQPGREAPILDFGQQFLPILDN